MSVRFGFYNSLNGDRKYDAEDMSHIFDGIINDGVFINIGTAFMVSATGGMNVNVGIGKAWLNHTWTWNDTIMPLTIETSPMLNRIDSIILDINNNEDVRSNTIQIIKGTPATVPRPPTLIRELLHNQYSIADIYVSSGATQITAANITNHIGQAPLPFVTGVVETLDITGLIAQWQGQYDEFITSRQNDLDQWTTVFKNDADQWFLQIQNELLQDKTDLDQWMADFKNNSEVGFEAWFRNLQDQLDDNQAANLQNQIDKLTELEFNRYYGMFQNTTTVTSSSSGGTNVVSTNADGTTMTTTIAVDANGATDVTDIINDINAVYIYTRNTHIEISGATTTVTTSFTRTAK